MTGPRPQILQHDHLGIRFLPKAIQEREVQSPHGLSLLIGIFKQKLVQVFDCACQVLKNTVQGFDIASRFDGDGPKVGPAVEFEVEVEGLEEFVLVRF